MQLPTRARIAALGLLPFVVPACTDDLDTGSAANEKIRELASPGDPPPDDSNAYVGNALVEALGHKFYFDTDFSGYGTEEDITTARIPGPIRAARGERLEVSCATCHDLDIGGTDPGLEGFSNHVSYGAGAYDVNSQPTINSAYNQLVYWNGRNDSLWSQIIGVLESRVSMFGSRLRVAWRIADAYRDEYEAAFPDDPLPPEFDSIQAQIERLEPDGSCKLADDGSCPEPHCHEWLANDQVTYCLPRFPLEGMPGFEVPGDIWQCDWGTDDPLQPFNDAFDCMDLTDRVFVNRIFVNWAKAIAAYEYTLISVESDFDRWVESDFDPTLLSSSARRGARLFVGKAACNECHSGPMLTDNRPHNIGVPQVGDFVPKVEDCPEGEFCDCVSDDAQKPTFCFPIGARDGLRLLQANDWRRDSAFSDDTACANKRALHKDANYVGANPDGCGGLVEWYPVPVDENTVGEWKTPTLRNAAITGPYMHNGMYETLREVVEHYDTAAQEFEGVFPGELDEDIEELALTDQEIDDLVAFLEALTGDDLDPAISEVPEIPPPSPFPETTPF